MNCDHLNKLQDQSHRPFQFIKTDSVLKEQGDYFTTIAVTLKYRKVNKYIFRLHCNEKKSYKS